MRSPIARATLFLLPICVAACTAPPPEPPKTEPPPPASATAAPTSAPAPEEPVPVPVTAKDPSWGSADAPVTLVEFADFECPFCDRVRVTLEELKETYGPEKLRIVWKHFPLPFHKNAPAASKAAHAAFKTSGNDGFWFAYHALFNRQRILASASDELLERSRQKQPDLSAAMADADTKLAEDLAVVRASGVTGTPAFYINGVYLSGAQKVEKFKAIIDEQLTKAAALTQKGVPANKLYSELARAQWAKVERANLKLGTREPAEEMPVRALPVGKSPVRGPSDALVTLVLVTDLRCPSCLTAAKSIAEASEEHAKDVRLVVKFQRTTGTDATDAALHLAIEARTKKGDASFWKVYDSLRAEEKVDDAALERAAAAAGLPVKASMQAVRDQKHRAIIDADEEVMAGVEGYPSHLYANGHFASPSTTEAVKKHISAELSAAQKLVEQGTVRAKVYDKIQERAVAPTEPERKKVPLSGKEAGRGPSDAKVTVQFFGNFESAPSQEMFLILSGLDPALAAKTRIVMRHLPSTLQPASPLAAEAAVEVSAQKGDTGFWAMATSMFAGRDHIDGLDKPALMRYAAANGLDEKKLAAALDSRAHKARVEEDVSAAKGAQIKGPTVLVGDMVLSNVSAARLRRLIRRAQNEAK